METAVNVHLVPPLARLYAIFGSCNTPPTDTIIEVSLATVKSSVKVTVVTVSKSVFYEIRLLVLFLYMPLSIPLVLFSHIVFSIFVIDSFNLVFIINIVI